MRQEIRSSDVFLKTDLVNTLQAMLGTARHMAATLPPSLQTAAYAAGYEAAITAMLVAIGAQDSARELLGVRS